MKTTSTLPNNPLQQYRTSLDNLDHALLHILAVRFSVTYQVGLYKKEHNLPPQDKNREAAQIERIKQLADKTGLSPEFATKILRLIMDEVVANHKKIREN